MASPRCVQFLCLVLALAPCIYSYPEYFVDPSLNAEGPSPNSAAGCTEHPDTGYGLHGSPAVQSTAITFALTDAAGTATAALCPGGKYSLTLTLNDYGYAYLTASQGTFSQNRRDGDTCTNRALYSDEDPGMPSQTYQNTLTLPCTATGSVELKASTASRSRDPFSWNTATLKVDSTCTKYCTTTKPTTTTAASNTTTKANSTTAVKAAAASPLPSITTTTNSTNTATSTTTTTTTNTTTAADSSATAALTKEMCAMPVETKGCTGSWMGYSCSSGPSNSPQFTIHWTVGGCPPANPCTAGYKLRNSGITANQQMLHMAASYPTTGYVSIGFAKTANVMPGMDTILGWVNSAGVVTMETYYVDGTSISPRNAYSSDQQFMVVSNAVEQNGNTTICFSRPLTFSAAKVSSTLSANGRIPMNWAVGRNKQDSLSEHVARGGFTLDLGSGQVSTAGVFNWINPHGALMLIAWLGLAPMGVLFARHKVLLGERKMGDVHVWFHAHRAIQMVAVAGFAAGMAIAWVKLGDPSGSIGEAHKILAYVMIATTALQLIGAFVRPKNSDAYRPHWNQFHWNLGRLTVALGIANVFLGIKINHDQQNQSMAPWLGAAIAILALYLVADILLTLKKSKLPPAIQQDVERQQGKAAGGPHAVRLAAGAGN